MTPQYLRPLQAAILDHPEAAALAITNDTPKVAAAEAAQRDAEVARLMREAGFGAMTRAAAGSAALSTLLARGRWPLFMRSSSAEAAATVTLSVTAGVEFDWATPVGRELSAGLVAQGLLDDADVAALEALCVVPSSVTAADVSRALRGPWGDE